MFSDFDACKIKEYSGSHKQSPGNFIAENVGFGTPATGLAPLFFKINWGKIPQLHNNTPNRCGKIPHISQSLKIT